MGFWDRATCDAHIALMINDPSKLTFPVLESINHVVVNALNHVVVNVGSLSPAPSLTMVTFLTIPPRGNPTSCRSPHDERAALCPQVRSAPARHQIDLDFAAQRPLTCSIKRIMRMPIATSKVSHLSALPAQPKNATGSPGPSWLMKLHSVVRG